MRCRTRASVSFEWSAIADLHGCVAGLQSAAFLSLLIAPKYLGCLMEFESMLPESQPGVIKPLYDRHNSGDPGAAPGTTGSKPVALLVTPIPIKILLAVVQIC
ncbi:MAG: hypothetical protein P4L53_11020 [Candidatus Obscuribacterales bacterium]|nr:hypothetical protein [Candidatus Obscuribacterales bacterium]